MKKSLKARMTLNRETLRNLNAEELTAAPGAGVRTETCTVCITQTCPTNCGQVYCYHVGPVISIPGPG
jgi:hypothetical protein